MKIIILGTLSVLFSSSVFAANLKDKKRQVEENASFVQEVDSANKACGTKMSGKIDWDSFAKGKADIHTMSIAQGFCGDAIGALRNLCSDATAKAEIAKKVKSFTCKFGGVGKRAAAFAGGQVTATIDFGASNNADFYKEKLENLL